MNYQEWESELQQALNPPKPAVPDPPSTKSVSGPVLVVAFLLLVATGFVFLYKKDVSVVNLFHSFGQYFSPQAVQVAPESTPQSKVTPPAIQPPQPPTQHPDTITDVLNGMRHDMQGLKQGQDQLRQEMGGVQKQMKKQGDRIILMGAIINENAIDAKSGGRDPLYFNGDWTIPRMPNHLKMEPEDEQFLRRFLKQ